MSSCAIRPTNPQIARRQHREPQPVLDGGRRGRHCRRRRGMHWRAHLASEHAGCLRTAPERRSERTALLRTGEPVVGSALGGLTPEIGGARSSRALTVASRANLKEIGVPLPKHTKTRSHQPVPSPRCWCAAWPEPSSASLQFGSNTAPPKPVQRGQRLTTPRTAASCRRWPGRSSPCLPLSQASGSSI